MWRESYKKLVIVGGYNTPFLLLFLMAARLMPSLTGT